MNKPTILSVDLGGTKILIGEVDQSGQVLSQVRYTSDVSSQPAALLKIKTAIEQYLTNEQSHGAIQAISISAVGRINMATTDWLEIHPKNSQPVNFRAALKDITNLPIYAANDVNCATIAEQVLGVGQHSSDFIYVNIGTGIAAGTVVDGKLLTGADYDAGEVGHMVVDFHSDQQCICGRYGCVEPLASGLGMSNQAKLHLADYPESSLEVEPNGRISTQQLMAAYDHNDPLAQFVLDQGLKAAATLLLNLTYVTNPNAIVLGGGVMNGTWFIDHLQSLLQGEAMRFVKDGVQVTMLNPNLIALIGAAMSAFDQLKGAKL